MVKTATSSPRMLGGIAASAVLLAAGLVPVATPPGLSAPAVAQVFTEVTLTADTIFDGPADAVVLDTPGVAEAFDIAGLLNAEFAAAQGLFNSLFSLPATLFNDVQGVFTSLADLNFGLAFSELFAIPQDIVNYVLGLPGLVVNTLYQMAVVIPGEFLFNFG